MLSATPGLFWNHSGEVPLKKLVDFQSASVPAMKISALLTDDSKRETNAAKEWSMPLSAVIQFVPASVVRTMFNPWEEAAQSVFGRVEETALSQPSPNHVNCQTPLVPV